jgi:hypothetical protein
MGIRQITMSTCAAVFSLPSGLAGMTIPCCAPTPARSTVTANSRAMITIDTHARSRPSETRTTSAATISSLSAIGSISLPKFVTEPCDRAR